MDNGHYIPLVWIVMTNKRKETYDEIFEELKKLQPLLNPTDVTTDFEMGAINSIQTNFPLANVHGCQYHLCHNVYKHIQQCGLQQPYQSDADFAHKLKMLMVIAFVPEDNVVEAFDELIETEFFADNNENEYNKEIQNLLAYFQTTYVYGINPRNGARRDPLFPPKLWNYYELTLEGAYIIILFTYVEHIFNQHF